MAEDRVLKLLGRSEQITSAAETPTTSNQDCNRVICNIDAVVIANSSSLFLTGWIDDRMSVLHQVRVAGTNWSKVIESRHIGRARRLDVDATLGNEQQWHFGFWALTILEPEVGAKEENCSVELVLTDRTSKSNEVQIKCLSPTDFKDHVVRYLGGLTPVHRKLPNDPAYLERILHPPGPVPAIPRHNIESVVVGHRGGIFVVGWIDDTEDNLDRIQINGTTWEVTFMENALARTRRDDVQSALGVAQRHLFGFWGLGACGAIRNAGVKCTYDLIMKSGARERREVPFRTTDAVDFRNMSLSYLGSCQYMGNPQLDSVASLDKAIGQQIIDLNLGISREIASRPHVERFGQRRAVPKASIVVCLYGKPEYFFLQNALFAGWPGIQDYEFVYVSNSPELAEQLLREARICSLAYGLQLTLVLLPGNAGFGAANNTAIELSRTDRILVVNPDVFPLDKQWAAKHTVLVEQLPSEQTTIFGATLYYDDGSLMHAGMYFDADIGLSLDNSGFRRNRILRVEHYGKGAPPFSQPLLRSRPVPAITGAFISVDRGWFEKLGGFSEEYVLGHYEDADLCLKSIENGICPWIHPLKLWHLEGKGSTRLPIHHGASTVNRWLFTKKWASTLVPDMLGHFPRNSLFRNEAIAKVISYDAARAHQISGPNQVPFKQTTLSLADTGRGSLGCQELIFGPDHVNNTT